MKKLKRMLIGILTLLCTGMAAMGFVGCKEEVKRLDVNSFTESSEGLEFKFDSDKELYTVTGLGSCTDTVLVVPAKHNGFQVAEIGRHAFRGIDTLTGVIIPNSVTKIKEEAFLACTNLTEVVVGNGVSEIEQLAFFNCSSLKYIEIPNNVTKIGSRSFELCVELENINIPDSINVIGSQAFMYCTSLTNIVIPNSVTSIGRCAFAGCDNLTSINYNGTIKEWDKIKKGDYLNDGTPATEVVCKDGKVAL